MELPIFKIYINLSRHHFCCFTVTPLLLWINLRLGIGVHNTLASKSCVKLLKPPKIQILTPNTSFRI